MFAVNSSPYNFASLFDTLQGLQQFQQHQRQLQQEYEDSRPKIVKKVETEDLYQIQIFQKNGNFDLYEVKVLRNAYPYSKSNLVNLVIESAEENFKKVFQFNLDDIEVRDIDWEYFQDQNVLVLNVPKKVHYCSDDFANSILTSLFGAPDLCNQFGYFDDRRPACGKRHKQKRADRKEERAARRYAEASDIAASRRAAYKRRELEKQGADRREALRLAEIAKKAEEARQVAARKAEEARQVAARKAEEARQVALQAEQERRRMVAAAAQAKREAEVEKARKIAEQRQRHEDLRQRTREEAHRRAEEEYSQRLASQQEMLRQLFGGIGFFPMSYNEPQAARSQDAETSETSQSAASPSPVASTQQQSKSAPIPESETSTPESADDPEVPLPAEVSFDEKDISDTESIHSDAESASTASASLQSDDEFDEKAELLHKHPSLEEVEDEEFVMFRKKFGQK